MIDFNVFLIERNTNDLKSMEQKELIEYFSEDKS